MTMLGLILDQKRLSLEDSPGVGLFQTVLCVHVLCSSLGEHVVQLCSSHLMGQCRARASLVNALLQEELACLSRVNRCDHR